MSWQAYRQSKLGDALVEALDAFIGEGRCASSFFPAPFRRGNPSDPIRLARVPRIDSSADPTLSLRPALSNISLLRC